MPDEFQTNQTSDQPTFSTGGGGGGGGGDEGRASSMGLAAETVPGAGTVVSPNPDGTMPFEIEHPHYQKMNQRNRWHRYRAILDGLEEEGDLKRYLPKAPYELDEFYKHRLDVSVFLGVSSFSLDRLVGAVFSADPTFETESESVKAWIEDTDQDGTHLREVIESVSGEANAMGIHYVAVHKVRSQLEDADGNPIEEVSQAQEEDAGVRRALLERINAENVINWGFDENGSLDFVVVREIVHRQAGYTTGRKAYQVFRIFTRQFVDVWERGLDDELQPIDGEAGTLKRIETAYHGLGRMTIEPFYGRRLDRMTGASYIRDSSRADLAKLHEDSWGVQTRSVHANPLLAIESSEELKELYIGGNAVRLDPDRGEKIGYVPLDTGPMDLRERASERFLREATLQTGSNPQMTSDGMTFNGESGRGQQVRFSQTEKRYIDAHSRALQSSTGRILDLVEMILDDRTIEDLATSEGVNVARFHTSFEVWETNSLASTYNIIGASIESPTFHTQVHQRIALDMVGDASPEIRQKIADEIEKSGGAPEDDDIDDEDE